MLPELLSKVFYCIKINNSAQRAVVFEEPEEFGFAYDDYSAFGDATHRG